MLAALLVSAVVLPMAVVNLLANWSTSIVTCQATWLLSVLAAHTILITLPCLAWENNTRLRGLPMSCISLTFLIIFSWSIGIVLVTTQWTSGFGPSYCESSTINAGSSPIFTSIVGVMLVFVPIFLSIAIHVCTLFVKNSQPNRRPAYKSSSSTSSDPPTSSTSLKPPPAVIPTQVRDLALPATNLIVTLITGFLMAAGIASMWWMNRSSKVTIEWFSVTAATGVGFIYAAYKPFREAYIQLFHYCCCKTTVSMSRRGRGDAAAAAAAAVAAAARPASDVRVHIIPGYNMYSTGGSREFRPAPIAHKPARPKEARRPKHPGKKDVYEL